MRGAAKTSLLIFVSSLLVAVGGCSFKASADDFTQLEVDGIAAKCGAKSGQIMFNRGSVVIIEPSPDDKVGICVQNELKATGKSHVSVVGNERYDPEVTNNAQKN